MTVATGDLVRSVAFSHDGRLLAVGHFGGTVALVSTTDWKVSGRRLAGHRERVTQVEFSPGDRTLVTAGGDDGTPVGRRDSPPTRDGLADPGQPVRGRGLQP